MAELVNSSRPIPFFKEQKDILNKIKNKYTKCKDDIFIIPLGLQSVIYGSTEPIAHANYLIFNNTEKTIYWIEPGGFQSPLATVPEYRNNMELFIKRISKEIGFSKSPTIIHPDTDNAKELYKSNLLPSGWNKVPKLFKYFTKYEYYSLMHKGLLEYKPITSLRLPQDVTRDENCTLWSFFIIHMLLVNPDIKDPKKIIEVFYKEKNNNKKELLKYIENYMYYLYYVLIGKKLIKELFKKIIHKFTLKNRKQKSVKKNTKTKKSKA